MFKKKKIINLKKYFKLIAFLICIGFIVHEFGNNYEEILNKVELNLPKFLFLFLFSIIFFNIIALKVFIFTKSAMGYFYRFSDWSKLFFESLVLNAFFAFSGTVYKAIQLKKRGVNYTKFIAISYLLFSTYVLITLIFSLMELLFLQNFFFESFIVLIIILISIFFIPTILRSLIKFFLVFKVFFKFFEFISRGFESLKKIYFKKTTLTILCLNTIVVHIFEIVIFYLVCTNFLENINAQTIITLFVVSFVIDRLPFISDIPGTSEIIVGLAGVSFGIFFVDGAIIKLTLRFLKYFSILFNSGLYFVVSFYDKRKFVD